jgi:heat shock protein HslJ
MSTARPLRLFSLILVTLGVLAAFTGCSSSPSTSDKQDSGRTLTLSANTDWVLVKWIDADGEKQPLLEPVPTLRVGDQGRISGQSGVNNYLGTARISGGELAWGGGFGLTRKAGPEALMASENRYLNSLKATRHVTVRGNKLLFTGEKSLRLEFTRAAN